MRAVLKLGGSVITEKSRRDTIDEPALERVVAAIAADAPADLVVVHGGGSFGHPRAADYGVDTGTPTRDVEVVRDIHGAMVALDRAVVERLGAAGVPAVPVHPLSAVHRDSDGTLVVPGSRLESLLESGFVPVLHGDVVATLGRGLTIASGDELVVAIATALEADRVGLCSDVPGVLDESGAVVDTITDGERAAEMVGASEETDVTGGMLAKVETLLGLERPAYIFGIGELPGFLAGDSPGTMVDGSRSP